MSLGTTDMLTVGLSSPPIATGAPGLAGTPPVTARVPRAAPPSTPGSSAPRLHRLGQVRRREGITRRTVARRLKMSVQDVEKQEQSTSDISLSDLYLWQEVLRVPLSELLVEPRDEVSPPLQLRARLLRVMKTVRSLQDRARQASVRRLAQVLVDQLVEIMPELKEATPWPSVGRRRRRDELGQAYFRGLPLDPLYEPEGTDD